MIYIKIIMKNETIVLDVKPSDLIENIKAKVYNMY